MPSCIVQNTAPVNFTTVELLAPNDGYQIINAPVIIDQSATSIFVNTCTNCNVLVSCNIYIPGKTIYVDITLSGITTTYSTIIGVSFKNIFKLQKDDTITFRLNLGSYNSTVAVGRIEFKGITIGTPPALPLTPVPSLNIVNGHVWLVGNNGYGQLGDGTTEYRSSPVQIMGKGNNWNNISAGSNHTVAIKDDGSLWTWGNNYYGQLGTNTTINKSFPNVTVASGSNWLMCSSGYNFTLALKKDGKLWTWGENSKNQLGDTTTTVRSSPVQSFNNGKWISCSAGYSHAAGIYEDNSLWCWGSNDYGECGIGNFIPSIDRPVEIMSGGQNWDSVVCGKFFTIGLKKDGSIWTWGLNSKGQFGNKTTTNNNIPEKTVNFNAEWKKIAGGLAFSGALGISAPAPFVDPCPNTIVLPLPLNSIKVDYLTITGTGTGDIQDYLSGDAKCYDSKKRVEGGIWLGKDASFEYTISFDSPQNYITFFLSDIGVFPNTSTVESFNIFANGLSTGFIIDAEVSCGMKVIGNSIVDDGTTSVGTLLKGIAFTISASSSYSTITISGPGGDGGSILTICLEGTSIPVLPPDPPQIIYGTSAYFAGGIDSVLSTKIDKFIYSTETFFPMDEILSEARDYSAGISDSYSKGYIAGGWSGSYSDITDIIIYANDVMDAKTTANLIVARFGLGGVDGSLSGYFAGGMSDSEMHDFEKLTYSTDQNATLSSPVLGEYKRYLATANANSLKGYFIGGYNNEAFLKSCDVLYYSSDTISAKTSADLAKNTASMAGLSGNPYKGYFLGGITGSGVFTTEIEVLDYATDSNITLTSQHLDKTLSGLAGATNGISKGYVAGGWDGTILSNSIYAMDYSYDSIKVLTGPTLSQARAALTAVSRRFIGLLIPDVSVDATYGYFAGGSTGSSIAVNTIDKVNYATDTMSTLDITLTEARYKLAALAENVNKGYFSGGNSGNYSAITERMSYGILDIIDAVSSLDLEVPTDSLAGISQGVSKGYFVGGFTGAETSVVTRFSFSPETKSALTTSALKTARNALSGIDGSGYKGYISGGSISAGFSSRMTEVFFYSTEAITSPESAYLSDGKRYLTAIGNRRDKGYFAGGIGEDYSSIDQIIFATDTTSSITTTLTDGRFGLAGISQGYTNSPSTAGKGYFFGGKKSGVDSSVFEKIDFSTDVMTALTTPILTQARNTLAGLSQAITPLPLFVATGGIVFSGKANVKIEAYYTGSGILVFSGSSSSYSNSYEYTGSGSIIFSGTIENIEVVYTWGLPIIYQIQNTIKLSLPIKYAVGQDIYYGYRIEGDCVPMSDCNGAFNSSSLDCNARSIITLIARTPAEACLQLKKQNWNWPIKKFQKYTKPVYKNDENYLISKGLYNSVCPEYLDTPFCNESNCKDFCVDIIVKENFTIGSNAILTDAMIIGSGGVLFTGTTVKNITTTKNAFYYPNVVVGSAATAGYFAGGNQPRVGGVTDTISKITYATNVMQAAMSLLQTERVSTAGLSGNYTYGYFGGGRGLYGVVLDSIEKIRYSDGTISATESGQLISIARTELAATSNGTTKGYFSGGNDFVSPYLSKTDIINYANDIMSVKGSADLTSAVGNLVGLDGNDSKGFFLGGETASEVPIATANRIVYSIDTISSTTTANLSAPRWTAAACSGNYYKGFITGGNAEIAFTERIVFATEITTGVASCNLKLGRSYAAGITQGISKGYFSGGYKNAGGITNTTEVILFDIESGNYTMTSGYLGANIAGLASAGPYKPYSVYPILGSVVFNSAAIITTTNVGMTNKYNGAGIIYFGGSSTTPNYFGVLNVAAKMVADIPYFVPYLSYTSGLVLVPNSVDSNIDKCGCVGIPLKFNLITNLKNTSDFTSFLERSNLSFDPILSIYYDKYSGIYLYAMHLQGRNNDGTVSEKWTVVANLNCNNSLNNFNKEFIWTLNLFIKRFVAGANDLDTNIQIWIPQSILCPKHLNNQLSFTLELNVQTGACLANGSTNIENVFINDRIELFNSAGWKINPILTIEYQATS